MRIGHAKTSYQADEGLLDGRWEWTALVLFLVGLALFPAFANAFWMFMVCQIAIRVISATGLNILTGFTGLVSLGQAAFMAVGAYTVAWLELNTGSPFLLNLLLGGFMAAALGIVFGLPSLRVKGLYLAIATIAASVILTFIFGNWASVTGGPSGLVIEAPTVLGVVMDEHWKSWFVILPITVLMVFAAANLFRTRIGRAFIAVRDRDISAEVLGIPLLQTKLMSFGIASFYAGIAGGLWMLVFRTVNPETFPLTESIFYLAAIIVGGMGSILGGILGAIFMTLTPEVLKIVISLIDPSPEALALMSPIRTIVFGLLIIGFLLFEPRGLAELWRRLRRQVEIWPFKT